MQNLNKAILVPVIASILQGVNLIFNKNIDDSWSDIIATILLFIIQVAGIFIHPTKNANTSQIDTNNEQSEGVQTTQVEEGP